LNQYIAGTIFTGAFGVVAFVAERKSRRTPKLHAFTTSTKEQLGLVSLYPDPNPDLIFTPEIPMKDVIMIYLNSRENRRLANEVRAEGSHPDGMKLFHRVEHDHKRIRRLAVACLTDRVAGKLVPDCKALYPRVLLWTYADEKKALDQLEP
jgi:hypothetical protein